MGSHCKKMLIWLMCLTIFLSGCAQPQPSSSQSSQSSEPEAVETMVSVPQEEPEPEPEPVPVTGTITLGEDTPDVLNAEQLTLIEDYFFYYYNSLAYLAPQDPAVLFSAEPMGQVQAYLHLVTFEVLTGVRSMQPEDLTLTAVEYDIVVKDIVERETGELMVRVSESNVQNFTYLPGVDAETLNIGHAFYMKETEEGWKLTRHWQNEDFHFLVADQFLWEQPRDENGISDVEAGIAMLDEIRDAILADAQQNLHGRSAQLERTDEEPESPLYAYDREAALAYADEWVGQRNYRWAYYDNFGGNCNNYTSQILFAGGIPMDISGPIGLQWKWYGEYLNENQTASGRSPAWSGVEEFYQYLLYNQWYGPMVDLYAGYFDGEPGDILQFGAQEDWKHTVVIRDIVTDEDGGVIDYLINSNTADRRNYPAMAYVYTDHRLIRVLGWNA